MAYRAFVTATVFATIVLSLLISGCSSGEDGERVLSAYLSSNQTQVDKAISVDDTPVRFVVDPGTPARAIGEDLVEAGLIGDDLLFEAYVRLNDLASKLEAGTFVLNPSMTMAEIVVALQDAQITSITITIPEGWRLEQVADYLAEIELFGEGEDSANGYRDQALSADLSDLDPAQYPFLQERPAGSSLEGFLFPDTYEIPAVDTIAAEVFSRQLDNFAAQVLPLYEESVAAGTTELSLFEALTLASIVEREAVVPEERPAIAGVYLNRIANGIALEADPTVQYAMGYQPDTDLWWKTPVYLEEYSSVVSPYNTYLNQGLPPGPIASPGLSSIQAVLDPAEHDYFYFVAVPDETGAHVFASTWDEHVVNVQRYQSGN